jgi:virulence-associated protein VagC
MVAITKVFKSGNSQAIRIPKEFRLDTDTTKIISKGDYLIIQPIKKNIRKGWNESFKKMHKNGDDTLLIDDIFEEDIDV